MSVRRFIATSVLVLVTTTGCASDAEVGDESILDFEDSAQQELGKRTTTTTPPGGAAPGSPSSTTTTTARSTATTTNRTQGTHSPSQAATFTISINSDTGAVTGFDPPTARVTLGTVVEWVNRDRQPRSVREDQGAFDSGPISPDGKFTWRAAGTGRFGYADGTRPYTVGQVEVVAG